MNIINLIYKLYDYYNTIIIIIRDILIPGSFTDLLRIILRIFLWIIIIINRVINRIFIYNIYIIYIYIYL